HGDALLSDVDGDEQLALRGRQRRAALRCPATALLAAALLPLGELLALGLAARGLCLRGLRGLCGLLGDLRHRRLTPALLASAPTTATAATVGLGGIGCGRLSEGGRLGYGRLGVSLAGAWGCICSRVVVLLPEAEPGQRETPSVFRRATAAPGPLIQEAVRR